MAQCKLTPQEFIKNAFTPQIAVLCSPAAEESCRKNNLCYTELLQPFCKVGTEVHYKDPNGTVVSLRNFRITLQNIDYQPPQTALARNLLNSSVKDAPEPRKHVIEVGEMELEVPLATPWFEAWRDAFLQVQFPSDHEFTKHFVACMLIVSTADENPVQTMVELSQKVKEFQMPSKLPKWFSNNVLKYHVILHENLNPNHILAVECYDALKESYGINNCFLLRINSRRPDQKDEQLPDPWSQFICSKLQVGDPTNSDELLSEVEIVEKPEINQNITIDDSFCTPDYHPLSPAEELTVDDTITANEVVVPNKAGNVLHGAFLTTEDVEQLKLLIHEFCTRALLPFVEKQVQQLTEYISNKKGVSRSLFSATKRWFTPNKPGMNTAAVNTSTYYFDAPELQIRRLGDLYFMFGHYSMAFQAYHTAKRDFIADQAWLHYAGALEMAALSAFMANESSRKTLDYMEESITHYLLSCKLAQFATRATLLSLECLRDQSLFGDAAHQLIRMTSEESDLRSALLLEQAAYCFLQSEKLLMVRKYAFHMVLAGHRYSKALQRKHSLRCYNQAYQVYQDKGWNLAQDHIHYTIGRQANNLNHLEQAVASYSHLITGFSRQSAQQQAVFFKEYLMVYSIFVKRQNITLPQILPLPLLESDETKVLVGPTAPLRTPGKIPAVGITLTSQIDPAIIQRWNKLEEMLVQEAQEGLPITFKHQVALFTNENITNVNPISILGEPIQVSVILQNPLEILLHLKDIYLLWQFKDKNGIYSNEINDSVSDEYVKTHYVKSIVVQTTSTQEVLLTLTPVAVGQITLKGVCYSLITSNSAEDQIVVKGKQCFSIQGPRVVRKDLTPDLQADKRLHITVVPSAPCLQVSFEEMNMELLRDELQQISVELRNVGCVPLCKVYMATSTPHLLSSCDFLKDSQTFDDVPDLDNSMNREKEARKYHVTHLPMPNGQLDPGQYRNIPLWIKAPDVIGLGYLDLLIYYENIDSSSVPKYRLVKHMWYLSVQESIKVDVSTRRSCSSSSMEQLTLSIKAVNMNKIHHASVTEISLVNAALLSTNWVLLNEVSNTGKVQLHSQESVHLLLKAERKISKKNSYSMISLLPTKESMQHSDSAYLDFAKRNGKFRMNFFNDAEMEARGDATLILRWQAQVTDSKGSSRIVCGQNHVQVNIINTEEQPIDEFEDSVVFRKGDDFALENSELAHLSSLQTQVRYNLIHPPRLVHDFKFSKFCIIPVYLILHNISDVAAVVTIKTLDISSSTQPEKHRPTLFCPYSSSNFQWLQAGFIVRTLNPLCSQRVHLSLAVYCPGTYNLGSCLEVWCHRLDQPETDTLQACQIESSVIIGSKPC